MNASERRKNAMPVSALLRFRYSMHEYGVESDAVVPGLCLTGMSLFSIDMTGEWSEESKKGRYLLLVVVFGDDGTIRVTDQYPAGWFDRGADQLTEMASLQMASRLLCELAQGGRYVAIDAEIDDSTGPMGGIVNGQ